MKIAKRHKPYLALLISTIIWGFNFIPLKLVLRQISPFTVAFVTITGAAMLFFIISYNQIWKCSRKIYIYLSIAGFFGIFGFNMLLNFGMLKTTATNASLLICTTPCLAIIFNSLFLRMPFRKFNLFLVIISISGAFLLITKGDFNIYKLINNRGDVYVLLGVISFVIYLTLAKKIMMNIDHKIFTSLCYISGALFFLPFALYDKFYNQLQHIDIIGIVSLVFIIVCTGVIANLLYNYGIAKSNIITASIFSNLIPLFAIFFAFICFGEMLNTIQFVAATLIMLSTFLATMIVQRQTYG